MKTAYKAFPQSSSVYNPTTGNTYASQYDVFTVGAGYLDIAAALASTDLASGTAMSPIANYDTEYGRRLFELRSLVGLGQICDVGQFSGLGFESVHWRNLCDVGFVRDVGQQRDVG